MLRPKSLLVACDRDEYQLVIYNLETDEQIVGDDFEYFNCDTSSSSIAVWTDDDQLHLYSFDGCVSDTEYCPTNVSCATFGFGYQGILAVGFQDGTIAIRDVVERTTNARIQAHSDGISKLRFAPDGRLFVASYDKTASIIQLDKDYCRVSSCIKLTGHTDSIFDLLVLPISRQCLTGSSDDTFKVWDTDTGACLRTLALCQSSTSFALHPCGRTFAIAGAHCVTLWSSISFEVIRVIPFPGYVQSVVFGKNNVLYAGVCYQGVMSCNSLTGEVGPVIVPSTGSISGLAVGKFCVCIHTHISFHPRASIVAPALNVWTSSTHAMFSFPAQQRVHIAVAVLWKLCKTNPHMHLPYELVELILHQAREPRRRSFFETLAFKHVKPRRWLYY